MEYSRSLIEASLDPLVMLRPDGTIADVNAATEVATGCSRTELIGTDFCDCFTEPARARACHEQVFREGAVRDDALALRRRDGHVLPVLYDAWLCRDEAGGVIGVFAAARDITDRKRTEEALCLGELRLRALHQLSQMTEEPVQMIVGFALQKAVESTRSQIGYVAFMNDDETALTVHYWSNASSEPCREAPPHRYLVTDPGPWAEAVRQRRPVITNRRALTDRWNIDCPSDREEVVCQTSVPVLEGERIVVVAGVANKESEYDESDIRQLTLLMVGMWRSLQCRRAEDRLRDATEALRRSEAYLAEAQRLSHTGSWAFDVAANTYVYLSDECARIFGLDTRKGMPDRAAVSRLVHRDDWDRVQRDYERSFSEKVDTATEFRIVLPGGTVRDVHVIRHPVVNEAGDVVEIVGTVMDVTERKRAEGEHRSYVTFLENMDRISRAVQGTNDLNRMMSDVLDAVLEIFGAERAWLVHPCDPDAASWRAVMEHTRPEFPGAFALGTELPMSEEIATVMRAALDSSRAVLFGPDYEFQMPAMIAERFAIQSQMVMALHPRGESPYLFGVHQCSHHRSWMPEEIRLFEEIGHRLSDALTSLLMFRNLRESERRLDRELTRLREAQSQVRAIETRFQECVDFAADALWLFSYDAKFIYVNRQASESLGYTCEELIGKTALEIDADHDAATFQRIADRVRAGEVVTFETHHRRKDGTVFPVEVRTRRFSQGGQMFGISVVRDITERKRVEAELRQALTALAHRQRVSILGELTASLAHEINQPIAATMIDATACLRALAPDRQDIDEARRAASRIVKEATWADEIIARTRALYKEGTVLRERVDVNAVIREMAVLFRREAPPEITIRTDLAETVSQAMADRVQLQQVLMNLLLNAMEAMKDTGGEVTIASHVEGNGNLHVSVSDTGVGLPAGIGARIFDPFVTTKRHGTGMGLAISRSIVESHRGRLWATGNAGAGATLHFTLPAASGLDIAGPLP